MATAKGKITASNIEAGKTVVRIVFADTFDGGKEWMPARIKRDSKLALVLENEALGNGRRRIVTKFGEMVVVGHQTFILAKDGETAEEPTAADFDAVEHVSKQEMPEVLTLDPNPAVAEVEVETPAEEIAETMASTAIAEAEKVIEKLPHEVRYILNEDLNAARVQASSGQDVTAAFSASQVSEKAERYRSMILRVESAMFTVAGLGLYEVDLKQAERNFSTARGLLSTEVPFDAVRLAERTAEMWARVKRLREEFEEAPEWRKERITAALAAMGTVVYPEGSPQHAEYSKALAEVLKEFREAPQRWRITFERIGRFSSRTAASFDYSSDEKPEDVDKRLRAHLGRYLTSREFNYTFEGSTLLIEGGRFGRGEATQIP